MSYKDVGDGNAKYVKVAVHPSMGVFVAHRRRMEGIDESIQELHADSKSRVYVKTHVRFINWEFIC